MKFLVLVSFFLICTNISLAQPICDFQGKDSVYVDVVNDTINIWDIAACAYRNSIFDVSIVQHADSIIIVQKDTTLDKALCTAVFDLNASLVGLSAGTYWAVIYREFYSPGDTLKKFVKAVQFQYQPAVSVNFYYTTSQYYRSGCGSDAVNEEKAILPKTFALYQNYPNPFNPTTSIGFRTQAKGLVRLKVADLLGREVALLVDGEMNEGAHDIVWNASQGVSGIFFYRLQFYSLSRGNDVYFTETRKMLLLR